MTAGIFPFTFLGEQANLLTAIVLGFGFGFALERAGFGNARKLAAQFYLEDMTVFKVMFTAILVAMVGYHAGVAVGVVDPARMWINPTFVWAQLVGGFLLGVGFIVSGLCPGTAVVSLASGRIDAVFALGGVFAGTFLFAWLVDLFPAIERLYVGGAWGVSVLPALLGVPAPVLALGIVVMAALAFVGVEKIERRVRSRRIPSVELATALAPTIEPAPVTESALASELALATAPAPAIAPAPAPKRARPSTLRWAVVGALAAVALTSGFIRPKAPVPVRPEPGSIEPLELAEALVENGTGLLVLDLRAPSDSPAPSLPGAVPSGDPVAVRSLLESMPRGSTVLLFDDDGTMTELPGSWPAGLSYRLLRGGFAAWEGEVLTPKSLDGAVPGERDALLRQNALAAYFSGAKLEPVRATPPPALPAGASKPKKKSGGC